MDRKEGELAQEGIGNIIVLKQICSLCQLEHKPVDE